MTTATKGNALFVEGIWSTGRIEQLDLALHNVGTIWGRTNLNVAHIVSPPIKVTSGIQPGLTARSPKD